MVQKEMNSSPSASPMTSAPPTETSSSALAIPEGEESVG